MHDPDDALPPPRKTQTTHQRHPSMDMDDDLPSRSSDAKPSPLLSNDVHFSSLTENDFGGGTW